MNGGLTQSQVANALKVQAVRRKELASHKACPRCGKPVPPASGRGNPRVWCSEECGQQTRVERRKLKAQEQRVLEEKREAVRALGAKHRHPKANQRCVECGKRFYGNGDCELCCVCALSGFAAPSERPNHPLADV